MYSKEVKEYLQDQLKSIKENGLYKEERVICSPQGPRIRVKEGRSSISVLTTTWVWRMIRN